MEGVPPSEVKDELTANAARREALKARVGAADAPPTLLHPEMAGLYRQKVTALAEALEHPETRTEASEALRGLIDAIVMTPAEGTLRIELKGNLAAMLGATVQSKRSRKPETFRCKYRWLRGRDLNPRPLGYEPSETADRFNVFSLYQPPLPAFSSLGR
jgi:hypothetical protein